MNESLRELASAIGAPLSELRVLALAPEDALLGRPWPIDLAQASEIDLRALGSSAREAEAAGVHGTPAWLVALRRESEDGGEEVLGLLLVRDPQTRVVWREVLRRSGAGGSAFESLSLEIEPRPRSPWPLLRVLQHALPRPGAPEQLPGPPLVLEFRYRGARYERES